VKVGLVGNQNSGKTSLFNLLTGMNSKIGNWPGVTIEKKTGKIKGTKHEIIDLPGIYSLSPYTNEEEVSRNFIFNENPDVIINIVDATSLERSLYLTTQLLELDCKVIVVLNMADLLSKKGLEIDINGLSKELGTKVVKVSALKETGIDKLINLIDESFVFNKKKIYDDNIESSILKIENKLKKELLHKRFISVKLLEQDEGFANIIVLIYLQFKNYKNNYYRI
jgi:ferrous iron transport protein B